jgi:hypothetical protein
MATLAAPAAPTAPTAPAAPTAPTIGAPTMCATTRAQWAALPQTSVAWSLVLEEHRNPELVPGKRAKAPSPHVSFDAPALPEA